MNVKTNLIEEYNIFNDLTKKQIKYFNINISLIVVILCLFLVFVLFKYLNEY